MAVIQMDVLWICSWGLSEYGCLWACARGDRDGTVQEVQVEPSWMKDSKALIT